jgi:hypothetical protein
MSEIKIILIFNQSAPGVWDDFLRKSNRTILSRAKDDWTQKHLARKFDNYKTFVSLLNMEHIK